MSIKAYPDIIIEVRKHYGDKTLKEIYTLPPEMLEESTYTELVYHLGGKVVEMATSVNRGEET